MEPEAELEAEVDRMLQAVESDRQEQKTLKKAARAGARTASWAGPSGWRSVDVGEDMLMGAEEGGFAGLEVLDDPDIIQALLPPSDQGQGQRQQAVAKPGSKRVVKQQQAAAAAAASDGSKKKRKAGEQAVPGAK